ncbi:AAA family ATPase [Bacteroides fragilis]
MNTLVELSIKDFKAIKRADVQLDGITVVSGINGCGKSTMSKLLYYIFRNANSFEELVLLYTNSQIRPYLNVLEQIQSLLLYRRDTSSYRRLYFRNIELTSLENTHAFLDLVKDLCARFLKLESDLQKAGNSIITERLRLILRSTLKSGEDRDTKKNVRCLSWKNF